MSALFEHVGIYGVGLIGGSLGMALRNWGLADKVSGIGRNPERMALCQQLGAIDQTLTLHESAYQCDLIVLCSPVDHIVQTLLNWPQREAEGQIITDVGSVKGNIVQAASQGGLDQSFLGGHPMAGSEHTGVEYAKESLFEGATWALTPHDTTPKPILRKMQSLVGALGATAVILSPEKHDKSVAISSHLPHALALAMGALMRQSPCPKLAAGSFRDVTRVVESSADLWHTIFKMNSQQIDITIGEFIIQLEQVRDAVKRGDKETIAHMFALAQQARKEALRLK